MGRATFVNDDFGAGFGFGRLKELPTRRGCDVDHFAVARLQELHQLLHLILGQRMFQQTLNELSSEL